MRAHANCVENLPVFGAIVFAVYASGIASTTVNYLCITVLVARVIQSLVHVCFDANDRMVVIRFVFFFTQLACFLSLGVMVVRYAG